MTQILHEPKLDTIMMVEKAICEAGAYPSKMQLWRSLPRKMEYQTFNRVLEYLEGSNKILVDGHRVVWIFPNNERLKKLLESSIKLR